MLKKICDIIKYNITFLSLENEFKKKKRIWHKNSDTHLAPAHPQPCYSEESAPFLQDRDYKIIKVVKLA